MLENALMVTVVGVVVVQTKALFLRDESSAWFYIFIIVVWSLVLFS